MNTYMTATQKHTPGPWKLDGRWVTDAATGCVTVAELPVIPAYSEIDAGDYQNEANARLIAAAPDLLEACKVALTVVKESVERLRADWPDSYSDGDEYATLQKLQSAIAHAEGKE